MEKYYGYIYKITHTPTGRYYIGQHRGCEPDSDGYLGSGKVWMKIVNKHPLLEFKKDVLATAKTKKKLCVLEEQLVGELYREDPLCQNLTSGGQVPPVYGTFTYEQKEHHRLMTKKGCSTKEYRELVSRRFKDKKLSKEHRDAISRGHFGIKPSVETRKKMSESATKRPKRILSEEHKKKISEAIVIWHQRRKVGQE